MCGKPCLEKAGYTVNSRISRSSSSGYESPNSMPLTKKNLDQHNRINGDVFTSESEASNQGFDGTHSECESFHTCPGFEIEQ